MKTMFAFFVVLFVSVSVSFAQGPIGPPLPPFPPPLPSVAVIDTINLYPSQVMTATVGEVATITIDAVLGTGEHKSDLRSVPVAFRVDGGKAEMFCDASQGICAVRSNEPGTVTFSVTSPDGIWGYRWVYIIFVPRTNVPGFLSSVDNLIITFNTNQVSTGEFLTGTITFPQTMQGQLQLEAVVNRQIKYFFFPNGVERGQRFTFLEKRANPLDDNYVFSDAQLLSADRRRLYAKGQGQTQPYKGFDMEFDQDAKTLKVTAKYGSKDDEYRVFITRGPRFVLEIPVRRFDLARGTELFFADGMFGFNVTLPDGRYTMSLQIRDRKTGWEYSKFETNGLYLDTFTKLR